MRRLLPAVLRTAAVLLTGLAVLAACDRPAAPDVPAVEGRAAPAAAPSVTMDSLVIEDSTLLFFVRYRYPQLHDAGPHTEALNRAFADSARAYAEAYRPEGPPPEESYSFLTDLDVGYDVFRLDGRLFSALFSVYTYTGGAHPNTDFWPLNYDLATGRPFGLDALFRPETPYLDTLSARTEAYLLGPAGGEEDWFWREGWAPEIQNFARFAVSTDSLHLFFPPYHVAPYAAGPFAFAVPLDALRPFLADEGPAEALRR
jgi:hypothetical protein